jgi:hypothetical protein
MIRIPYKSFTVQATRSGSTDTIYRPMILLRVFGPDGDDVDYGLVDTGADDTLFPNRMIARLGVVFNSSDYATIAGIDDSVTIVRYATVDLELLGAGGGYRFSSRVGFHAGHKIALGHNGFLEYFAASFNGRNRHLTLTPNGTAKASN